MDVPFRSTQAAPLSALFFLPDMDGGGAQRTTLNLVNHLHDFSIRPTLVAARGDGPARAWLSSSVPFIDLGLNRSAAALLPLRRLLSRLAPDVLFATMVNANIVASLAACGTSIPVILRETNSHRARGDLGWLQRCMIRQAYRRASSVIALSSGIADELLIDYGLQASRLTTIGNPVETADLKQQALRARMAPPPFIRKRTTILGIGRLNRQKGFDILIEAVARMSGDADLIILGEGSERKSLEALAYQHRIANRVAFPGFVKQPAEWLAHADLFVLSSRWEGFGHVIVEAMAAGTPVIATRCPHGPADIIHDGENGCLVESESPAALAAALDRLITSPDLRVRLASKARESCEQFSSGRIAARYAAIFRTVARPGNH